MVNDITSGTVNATPLGDIWVGVIEHATAGSGSVVGVQEIMGRKIGGIVFARESAGANGSPTFSSTSGSVTLTGASTSTFFVAQSKAQ